MRHEQADASAHVRFFLAEAASRGIDLQIGVTTTDLSATGAHGRLVPLPPTSSPRILSSDMPNLESLFAERVRVGTMGLAATAGLEAARLALELSDLADDPFSPLPGDGNLGLVRDDAALSIVFMSDGEDHSPLTPYANTFLALKEPGLVRAHGMILDPITGCGGHSGRGDRYHDVIEATGGHWESICTDDWAGALARLGAHAFSFDLPHRYELTALAACAPSCDGMDTEFEVLVDGILVPPFAGGGERVWHYDGERNAVEFIPAFTPLPHQKVTIRYPTQCIPSER